MREDMNEFAEIAEMMGMTFEEFMEAIEKSQK